MNLTWWTPNVYPVSTLQSDMANSLDHWVNPTCYQQQWRFYWSTQVHCEQMTMPGGSKYLDKGRFSPAHMLQQESVSRQLPKEGLPLNFIRSCATNSTDPQCTDVQEKIIPWIRFSMNVLVYTFSLCGNTFVTNRY